MGPGSLTQISSKHFWVNESRGKLEPACAKGPEEEGEREVQLASESTGMG